MPRSTRALGLVTTLALALPAATAALASGPAHAEEAAKATTAPFRLWAPPSVTAYAYRNKTWTDLGLRVIAENGPFELWSHRPSYDDQIETTWRSADGDVALPTGAMTDFSGFKDFVTITVTPKKGTAVTMNPKVCFSSYVSERVEPDAPATSPYPTGCYFNAFSLGSVQGVQEGWATSIMNQDRPLKIGKGTYDVTATVTPAYASLFGLSADEATVSTTLKVKGEQWVGEGRRAARHASGTARPAAHRPTGAVTKADEVDGPQPDLQSFPAWGISLSKSKKYLRFSATVWNAGDSPLVVDGFRNQDDQDLMDAYQYFFDADGNQVGYTPVGHMHWDADPSHNHWHFEDFARYSLLNSDLSQAVVSKKDAFCLANTDAADLTVTGAAWKPENMDLATSCGDYSSLSIREVLASGWGDTYTQYRAGQSLRVDNLPNGTYYVAVDANPDGNLVESDTTNNQSLRKIKLSGKGDKRKVTVKQVGIIEDENYGGTG
ncbi:lysyl oxidase family protein [Nocardioides mangrovi]|uniref:Lysyl oxidase n=1 Tax=Nocardioides mangrovi TaxID=2874580 RepID=A0ABS7U6Y6_9ACTN|nr:lysyl oxidase family protein [Nocardioides mangrovi]MBZ5736665.1 hypothetical protein [Nocardioides mangrovi]